MYSFSDSSFFSVLDLTLNHYPVSTDNFFFVKFDINKNRNLFLRQFSSKKNKQIANFDIKKQIARMNGPVADIKPILDSHTIFRDLVNSHLKPP